jgi:hypothetical protein
MFSSVSKLVDKAFVVGFIVPTLIGALASLWLFRDYSSVSAILDSITDAKDFTKLTVFLLILWTLAILLMILNNLIFRVFEGYYGPLAGALRKERMREQYTLEQQFLKDEDSAIRQQHLKTSDERALAYLERVREFVQRWPTRRGLVLPTRFGNAIRAFETYPESIYGIDGIPGWLRLQAVMGKDFETIVEDARAHVSFFVNISAISCAFALLAIGRLGLILCKAMPNIPIDFQTGSFLVAAMGGMFVSRAAYKLSVNQARAWGDMVRSAFDTYLPDLATKMGYALPSNQKDRRLFWQHLTSTFLYNESLSDNLIRNDSPPPTHTPERPENAKHLQKEGPKKEENGDDDEADQDDGDDGEADRTD